MCNPILVTLLKLQPHYSQTSHENATPTSGTSPLASYKEVPPPPPGNNRPFASRHACATKLQEVHWERQSAHIIILKMWPANH